MSDTPSLSDIVFVDLNYPVSVLDSLRIEEGILVTALDEGQRIRVTGLRSNLRDALHSAGMPGSEVVAALDAAQHATLADAFNL